LGTATCDAWLHHSLWTTASIPGVLVWMDLEMTGLDPTRNVIVEIATIVTNDDLDVVAVGPDLVVKTSQAHLDLMEPIVHDMHERSGLLDAIAASDLSLADAGNQTLDFIKSQVPQSGTVPLCGSSIGTDRRFLAAQLPEIEDWLHYRSVDVSTIKELCRRWYPAEFKKAPPKRTSPRALDDIRESIAELSYYRTSIFIPESSPTVGPSDTKPAV
jgi:oligoribonuclease